MTLEIDFAYVIVHDKNALTLTRQLQRGQVLSAGKLLLFIDYKQNSNYVNISCLEHQCTSHSGSLLVCIQYIIRAIAKSENLRGQEVMWWAYYDPWLRCTPTRNHLISGLNS